MGEKVEIPLYLQISDRLEKDIPAFEGDRLPPIRDLCKRYGVSSVTMLKAARRLRDKGLLTYSWGRPMLIVGRDHDGACELRGAVAATVNTIEEGIKNGRFRAGQQLPKLQFFASMCRVSRDTVYEALAILERRGLIHKKGRKRIVGPRAAEDCAVRRVVSASGSSHPVVVLIIPTFYHFRLFFNYYMNVPLFHSLLTELNSFGVELAVALREPSIVSIAFPAGMVQTLELIRNLGGRYVGSMIACGASEFPDAEEWIAKLKPFRKPVCIYNSDIDDTSGLPPRMEKGCFRVYQSTGRAAENAVDVLYGLGHRRLAIVQDAKTENLWWMQKRRDIIRRHAAQIDKSITVDTFTMSPLSDLRERGPEWHWSNPGQSMIEHIENIRKSHDTAKRGEGALSAIREQLISEMPEIETFARKRAHTAIIAANDEVATDLHLWMRYTGRNIPADFSLISFDNTPALILFGFSTFEMGLVDLGYLTAHMFIGDIPVKKDPNGNVTAAPRLYDRGSLARLTAKRTASGPRLV